MQARVHVKLELETSLRFQSILIPTLYKLEGLIYSEWSQLGEPGRC